MESISTDTSEVILENRTGSGGHFSSDSGGVSMVAVA